MTEFIKCLRIESSFIEDDLIVPKKGYLKLEITDSATIILKIKTSKGLIDSKKEQKTIKRKVLIINTLF